MTYGVPKPKNWSPQRGDELSHATSGYSHACESCSPQHGRLNLIITSTALCISQQSRRLVHTSIAVQDIVVVDFLGLSLKIAAL